MCHILMIEDDAVAAEAAARILERSPIDNFSVDAVRTFSEAMERLETCFYDAVLLDLFLPDSSGVDTVRRAREMCPAMPIIVLSGIDDCRTTQQCIDAGADCFVVKPYINLLPRQVYSVVQLVHSKNKLKAQSIQLEKAMKLYEGILNASPDWIVRTTPDGVIIYANSAACAGAGKDINDVIGTSIYDYISPEYHQLARLNYARLSQESKVVTGSEFKVCGRWIAWIKVAIFDSNGNIEEVQSIGRDMTQFHTQALEFVQHLEDKYNAFSTASEGAVETTRQVMSDTIKLIAQAKQELISGRQ